MISSTSYNLTLAYREVATLQEHLYDNLTNLELLTNEAEFTASAHGITIYFTNQKSRDRVMDLMHSANREADE